MPDFPRSHAKLRKIVNGLLGSEILVGKLLEVEKLSKAVSHAAQLSDSDSSELKVELKTAYQVASEHAEHVPDTHDVVFAKKTREGHDGIRESFVGRFESAEAAQAAATSINPPRSVIMSKEEISGLIDFLQHRRKKKQTPRNMSKNKNKDVPKKAASSKKKRKDVAAIDTEEEQRKKKRKEEEAKEAEMLRLLASRARQAANSNSYHSNR